MELFRFLVALFSLSTYNVSSACVEGDTGCYVDPDG